MHDLEVFGQYVLGGMCVKAQLLSHFNGILPHAEVRRVIVVPDEHFHLRPLPPNLIVGNAMKDVETPRLDNGLDFRIIQQLADDAIHPKAIQLLAIAVAFQHWDDFAPGVHDIPIHIVSIASVIVAVVRHLDGQLLVEIITIAVIAIVNQRPRDDDIRLALHDAHPDGLIDPVVRRLAEYFLR